MMNRRQFAVGTCCAFHAAFASPRESFAQIADPVFICATIEPPREDLDIPPAGSPLGGATAPPAATNAADPNSAGQAAAANEPSSQPQSAGASEDKPQLTPFGTAFLAHRWRPQHGLTPNTGIVTLGVHFLEGTASQRDAVRSIASAWVTGSLSQRIAFEFDAQRHRSQIRVAFTPGEGNWSYVGNQNRSIAPTQKTMNLENVTQRVILHEFGHALGLQHEHLNPGSGIVWNEPAVIADMAAQGWSESTTRSNILTRYGKEAACVGDPQFNRDSIMMYPIPTHWTKNGFSAGQTNRISTRDLRCLQGVYA